MKTVKAFVAQSHIPAALIRAVVRQIGGWAEFKERAQDVANHGADGGFSGFTYYTETVAFAKRQRTNILAMAGDQASDFGSNSVYSLIAGFNCLGEYSATDVAEAIHNPRSTNGQQVLNALAWYALEETARSYTDLLDQ